MAKTTVLIDPSDAAALTEGRHSDPFGVLGPHKAGRSTVLRVSGAAGGKGYGLGPGMLLPSRSKATDVADGTM